MIGEDRESEKLPFLSSYDDELDQYETKGSAFVGQKQIHITEQSSNNEQERKYIIKTIDGLELIEYCKGEITEVEKYLLTKFINITSSEFNPRILANDEHLKKEIVHLAYRWSPKNHQLFLSTLP